MIQERFWNIKRYVTNSLEFLTQKKLLIHFQQLIDNEYWFYIILYNWYYFICTLYLTIWVKVELKICRGI